MVYKIFASRSPQVFETRFLFVLFSESQYSLVNDQCLVCQLMDVFVRKICLRPKIIFTTAAVTVSLFLIVYKEIETEHCKVNQY